MDPATLEGKLVRLREFSTKDADWYWDFNQTDEIWRYTGGQLESHEATAQYISNTIDWAKNSPRYGYPLVDETECPSHFCDVRPRQRPLQEGSGEDRLHIGRSPEKHDEEPGRIPRPTPVLDALARMEG